MSWHGDDTRLLLVTALKQGLCERPSHGRTFQGVQAAHSVHCEY